MTQQKFNTSIPPEITPSGYEGERISYAKSNVSTPFYNDRYLGAPLTGTSDLSSPPLSTSSLSVGNTQIPRSLGVASS